MSIFYVAKAQKEHHEKKEKAKLARTQIDFVGSSATKRSISVPATTTGSYIHTIALYYMRYCCIHYVTIHIFQHQNPTVFCGFLVPYKFCIQTYSW